MMRFTRAEQMQEELLAYEKNSLFDEDTISIVKQIVKDVSQEGDQAVRYYTCKFDGLSEYGELRVPSKELEDAYASMEEEVKASLRAAIKSIKDFHKKQLAASWTTKTDKGSVIGSLVTPIEKVAVYVPGGKAAYPSSVIMNVVPALIAGVEDISIFTPPSKDGSINKYVAATAFMLGIDKVYRIGGAQAIAAAAYGTATVEKVYKIVGPGNSFVAAAKREVFGLVDIDMIAGPSEIMVIADDQAKAEWVAADLLSQAEHDEKARCILVTDSIDFGRSVVSQLELQIKRIKNKSIAESAIAGNSTVVIVKNWEEAAKVANAMAPEHLEIMVKNPEGLLRNIKNAGAIFVGAYSPEAIGDYIAGPNHVLPTSGTARFSSPLSVKDFQKSSSYIAYGKEDFMEKAPHGIRIAELEGLEAHANSLKWRLKDEEL